MNTLSTWPIYSVALALFSLAMHAIGVGFLVRRSRLASVPGIYLTFVVVSDAIGLAVAKLLPATSPAYFYCYWYGALVENILLCIVAVEIICALLPWRRFVLGWATAIILLIMLSGSRDLPSTDLTTFVNLALLCNFAACLIMVPLLFAQNLKWTREMKLVAVGVAVGVLPSAMAAVKWLENSERYAETAAVVFPLGGLISAVLLFLGASTRSNQSCRTS